MISAFRTPAFGQSIPSALQPNKPVVPSSLETRLRDLKTPTDRQSALKAMEDPEIFQVVTDGEIEKPPPKIQASEKDIRRSFKFLSWSVEVLVFLDKMRRIYRAISKVMQHCKQYIQALIGKMKQWIVTCS